MNKTKTKKRYELYKKGFSIDEIAKMENTKRSNIITSLNKIGIKVKRKNTYNTQKIYDDFKKGMSLEELSTKYNTDKGNITWHLNKIEKISFKKSYKDNKEKINKVLELYNKGYSLFKICILTKTSDRYVKAIFKDYNIKYKNKPQFRKKHIYENIFDVIDTQEKAYWLGMLYADGYVTSYHKKGDKYCIELCLKDKEHIQKFIDFLGDKEHEPTKKIVKLNDKTFIEWRYAVNSKQLTTSLIEKGCVENKSLILKFPNKNIVPEELLCHFLRGYTDGDGSIGISNNMFFYNLLGTKEFLDEVIKIYLNKNLIVSIPKYQMNGKAYAFSKAGKQVKKIVNFLHPKNTTIYLERKYNKIAVLLGEE